MNRPVYPHAGRAPSRVVSLLAVGLALVLAQPSSATAADYLVSGYAVGAGVDVRVPGQSGVSTGYSPQISTPFQDSVTPQKNTTASFSVAGLLTTGQLVVSIAGPQSGEVAAAADVADVAVPAVFTADTVQDQCTSDGSGTSGSATLGNASVDGVAVPADPAPDTLITVPGVADVTLNAQQAQSAPGSVSGTVPGTIEETAVLISFPPGSPAGSGIIDIGEIDCNALISSTGLPVGAVGGVLLTGVLGVLFALRGLRHRSA